jgi:hypothetical protein
MNTEYVTEHKMLIQFINTIYDYHQILSRNRPCLISQEVYRWIKEAEAK